MNLTDQQIEILKDVRAYMNGTLRPSPFICVNIQHHALGSLAAASDESNYRFPMTHAEFKEKFPVHYELIGAIEKALHHYTTLTAYMLRAVPGFEALNNNKKIALSDMARLAWLDRMIETRVIA